MASHELIAIVVSTDNPPIVQRMTDFAGTTLELNGQMFSDSGVGDWLGFYDWLRSTSGEVIGVRIWLDEEFPQLPSIQNCIGVSLVSAGPQLQLFFGQNRDFAESASCDQDFGANQLLISRDRFAFTFNAPPSEPSQPAA